MSSSKIQKELESCVIGKIYALIPKVTQEQIDKHAPTEHAEEGYEIIGKCDELTKRLYVMNKISEKDIIATGNDLFNATDEKSRDRLNDLLVQLTINNRLLQELLNTQISDCYPELLTTNGNIAMIAGWKIVTIQLNKFDIFEGLFQT